LRLKNHKLPKYYNHNYYQRNKYCVDLPISRLWHRRFRHTFMASRWPPVVAFSGLWQTHKEKIQNILYSETKSELKMSPRGGGLIREKGGVRGRVFDSNFNLNGVCRSDRGKWHQSRTTTSAADRNVRDSAIANICIAHGWPWNRCRRRRARACVCECAAATTYYHSGRAVRVIWSWSRRAQCASEGRQRLRTEANWSGGERFARGWRLVVRRQRRRRRRAATSAASGWVGGEFQRRGWEMPDFQTFPLLFI